MDCRVFLGIGCCPICCTLICFQLEADKMGALCAVIVLCGNKSDLVENRAISIEAGQELAAQYACLLPCAMMLWGPS